MMFNEDEFEGADGVFGEPFSLIGRRQPVNVIA
jgi:hypothetical protein